MCPLLPKIRQEYGKFGICLRCIKRIRPGHWVLGSEYIPQVPLVRYHTLGKSDPLRKIPSKGFGRTGHVLRRQRVNESLVEDTRSVIFFGCQKKKILSQTVVLVYNVREMKQRNLILLITHYSYVFPVDEGQQFRRRQGPPDKIRSSLSPFTIVRKPTINSSSSVDVHLSRCKNCRAPP